MANAAVLGLILMSAGHVLSFNVFKKTEASSLQLHPKNTETKIKGLQEQFLRATRTEKKTQEEVDLVKNRLEKIEKSQEKMEEEVTAAKDEIKKMGEEFKNLKINLEKAASLQTTKLESLEDKLERMQEGMNGTRELDTLPLESTLCPKSFKFLKTTGQCLLLVRETISSIPEGSQKCAGLHKGAHLAVLDTPEKLRGAKMYLNLEGQMNDVLIGGFSQGGKYAWITEEEIGPSEWCENQPDSLGLSPAVGLWQAKGFCLDDTYCNNQDFLCEVGEVM